MTFLPEEKQQKGKDVLRRNTKYTDLHFYQKTDVVFQLTYIFCKRFLPKYGDRTVDQMVQAARSSKQNIVEGIEDGNTSTWNLNCLMWLVVRFASCAKIMKILCIRVALLVGTMRILATTRCSNFAGQTTRQSAICLTPTNGRQRSSAIRCLRFATSRIR